jgi:hypothetical protein
MPLVGLSAVLPPCTKKWKVLAGGSEFHRRSVETPTKPKQRQRIHQQLKARRMATRPLSRTGFGPGSGHACSCIHAGRTSAGPLLIAWLIVKYLCVSYCRFAGKQGLFLGDIVGSGIVPSSSWLQGVQVVHNRHTCVHMCGKGHLYYSQVRCSHTVPHQPVF